MRSFFDPKKKAAMMARIKKGQPPPEFGNSTPFTKVKDKLDDAASEETAAAMVKKIRQPVIQHAINTAKVEIEKAEQNNRSKWRLRGHTIPPLAFLGLTSAAGTAAFRLFVIRATDIASPLTFYLVASAAMATIGAVIYVVADVISGMRITSYFERKFMDYGMPKYDAIRKVLDHLQGNKPINLSNEELREIAKDFKQVNHLKIIAAAGSAEARVVIDMLRLAVRG